MNKCAIPMHKLILIALFLTSLNSNLFAQAVAPPSSAHEYFIRISGINSRQDVEYLQTSISKKQSVIYFMANRYPVRYFLMRSDRPVTANDFELFLRNTPYRIEFYGKAEKGREEAILIYNKLKAPQ